MDLWVKCYPVGVAQKTTPINLWYAGVSETNLVKTAQVYGSSVEQVSDTN